MEVESTTRSAKERVAGFEGREGHRTPFAPVFCEVLRVQSLLDVRKFRRFGFARRRANASFSLGRGGAARISSGKDSLLQQNRNVVIAI